METFLLRRMCSNYARLIRPTNVHNRQLSCQHCAFWKAQHRCYSSGSSEKPPKDDGEGPFISRHGKPQIQRDIDRGLKDITRQMQKEKKAKRTSWIYYAALGGTVALFFGVFLYLKKMLKEKQLALVQKSVKESDPVLIGGDWELVDHNGKVVTNKDFVGQWCILYFGFTHCPDICPDEIDKIIEVTEILERDRQMPKMIPLFVTVDPERDSPEAMKGYLEEFSDKLIGLTGNWDQLRVILKEFKVYFSMGPKDEDGDYIVDHSIITFLMNPAGKYSAHFPRSKTNIEIAEAIGKQVKAYKQ